MKKKNKDVGKKASAGEKKKGGRNKSITDEHLFDDCPICRATKKAMEEGRELSLEELLKLFEEANGKNMNIVQSEKETIFEIMETRKEIESDFKKLAKRVDLDFDFENVKRIIFEEKEQEDMMEIVAMFDQGGGAEEMSNILDLATDAWNYFPHKVLGGLSPAEMLLNSEDNGNNSGPIASPFV